MSRDKNVETAKRIQVKSIDRIQQLINEDSLIFGMETHFHLIKHKIQASIRDAIRWNRFDVHHMIDDRTHQEQELPFSRA